MVKGLQFKKIDLHVHTPASKCFIKNSCEAKDFIDKAIPVGLDAIAITDHNSGGWADIIKNED